MEGKVSFLPNRRANKFTTDSMAEDSRLPARGGEEGWVLHDSGNALQVRDMRGAAEGHGEWNSDHIRPNVFTGKPYEDMLTYSLFHGMSRSRSRRSIPMESILTRFLSLLTDSGLQGGCGLVKNEDGSFDELGQEVISKFEAGEALKLTVLSILGKDVVIACDVDTGA